MQLKNTRMAFLTIILTLGMIYYTLEIIYVTVFAAAGKQKRQHLPHLSQ
jgi:hypothetical protein